MQLKPVFIEFIADTAQIEDVISTLSKMGLVDAKTAASFKQTSSEITKQASAIKLVTSAAQTTNKSLQDVAKASKGMSASFMQGFQEGVVDALQEAGVSAKEFADSMNKSGSVSAAATKTIKAELREFVEMIARAKASGQDYGTQYDDLVKKAGSLKDAIGDVNIEINNVASDTSNIDGLIGVATGVAGAFSIAQGAAALFGSENEELQKTLLKVNAALATLQGLQAVGNALQKESAALKFLDKTATNAQAAAQKAYALVVGSSTGALKAFRIALASTGIGLLILAIGALVANWDKVKEAISGVSREQKDMVATTVKTAEAEEEKLDALSEQDQVLKLQGKTEREILTIKRQQIEAVIESRKQQLLAQESIIKTQIETEQRNRKILSGILDFLLVPINAILKVVNVVADFIGKDLDLPTAGEWASGFFFDEKEVKEEGEASLKELRSQIASLENERAGYVLSVQGIDKAAAEQSLRDRVARTESLLISAAAGSKKELELQKKLLTEKAHLDLFSAKSSAERQLIADKLHESLLQADATFEKARIDIAIAAIENQLAVVKSGSREELRLKQKLIELQAAAELTTIKLSAEEKENIIRKSNDEQIKIGQEYNKKILAQSIQDAISLNNAELALLGKTANDRLLLQIANIELAARAEVEAAKDNTEKIIEINAKRDESIKDARLKFIQDSTEKEIEEYNKRESLTRSALEKIVSNERIGVKERLLALDQLTIKDQNVLDIRLKALKIAYAKMLITDQQYADQYSDILGKMNKVAEDNAKERGAILQGETKNWLDVSVEAAQQIGNVLSGLADLNFQQDAARIESQRVALDEAVKSGSITEKEAIARAKRIDAEEKKIKIEAAKRDKEIAIYNAIINTAAAVVRALASAPPPFSFILAGIAAAAGATQVALISSRPLPKFSKGKNKYNRYEGYAEVAESGRAELIERNGQLFIAKKPIITWLGSNDVVYSPQQTQKKIQNMDLQRVSKQVMSINSDNYHLKESKKVAMDAAQHSAELVGKYLKKLPIQTFNFDQNGFNRSIQDGLSKVNYYDKRYTDKW